MASFSILNPPTISSDEPKFKLVLVSDDRIDGGMQGAIDIGNISGKVVLASVKERRAGQATRGSGGGSSGLQNGSAAAMNSMGTSPMKLFNHSAQ